METRILSAPDLDFWVEVRLLAHDGRWIAVAVIAGEPELGWGISPGAALRMALSSLGPAAVQAFDLDPTSFRLTNDDLLYTKLIDERDLRC